jgi:FkbM family methyltransferase
MMRIPNYPIEYKLYDLACIHPLGAFLEYIIEGIYREIVPAGSLVVDGGAHLGRHSFPLCEVVGSAGLVYAIEAIPELAAFLKNEGRKKGYKQFAVVSDALGASERKARFVCVRDDMGYSGLRHRDLPEELAKSTQEIEVSVRRLDEMLAHHNRKIRFVKLDLEGGEYDALKGMTGILERDRPFLVLENNRDATGKFYGYDSGNWFDLFESVNYEVYDVFGRTFAKSDWNAAGIPWYNIAVAANSADDCFVNGRLRTLVSDLATAYQNRITDFLALYAPL